MSTTAEDLEGLGYTVDDAAPPYFIVSGFGLHLYLLAEDFDQIAATHADRAFQIDHPDRVQVEQQLRRLGYTVERGADSYTVTPDGGQPVAVAFADLAGYLANLPAPVTPDDQVFQALLVFPGLDPDTARLPDAINAINAIVDGLRVALRPANWVNPSPPVIPTPPVPDPPVVPVPDTPADPVPVVPDPPPADPVPVDPVPVDPAPDPPPAEEPV